LNLDVFDCDLVSLRVDRHASGKLARLRRMLPRGSISSRTQAFLSASSEAATSPTQPGWRGSASGGSIGAVPATHELDRAEAGTKIRMPIEVGIWRIDSGSVEPVPASSLESEARLEDVLERDPTILGLDSLLVIGRQVITKYGKRVDLLAIDVEGTLYVVELKKDRTPREVVAQALDYGFWVRQLDDDQIAAFYSHHNAGASFAGAFEQFFGQPPPVPLNASHQLIIVASELDPSTERIVTYAADYDVPLNVVFFQYFKDGTAEYLTRSWLIDPAEAEERSRAPRSRSRPQETWNGQDFYYSVGEGPHRNWDDMVRYGFISSGGGRWYSNTLKLLEPGHRVFACIPQRGYVGVGIVKESVQPPSEFVVDVHGQPTKLVDAPLVAPNAQDYFAEEPDKREYVVRVEWIRKRSRDEAFWKPGMYANQNSVTRLRQTFTLEELTREFDLGDDPTPND
jgi:hypothetical protein